MRKRSRRITTNLTEAEGDELDQRAAEAGVSLSQCVRWHLTQAADRSTAVLALREYDRQEKS